MIGVDFGGTRIKVAEVTGAVVRARETIPTPERPSDVLDAIAKAVLARDPRPREFGVAIPGEVDELGVCHRVPNVAGFEGVHVADDLASRTGARVTVENDGTAAALGERLFGAGKRYGSFVVVTLGTGIGGGVVLDGHLRRGKRGFAGEVGHVLVDEGVEGWPCPCGRSGCVEAYAGTAGLLRKYRELGGAAELVEDIADAAGAGEVAALAVFEFMGRALARSLTSIQNILDLDAFVFTGGVSRSFSLIEPSLRAGLRALAYAPALAEVPLIPSDLGEDAGLVGAAHLVSAFAVRTKTVDAS